MVLIRTRQVRLLVASNGRSWLIWWQVLASLPEIENSGLVLPGLSPMPCGNVGDLEPLWDDRSISADASQLMSHQAATADQYSAWSNVLPLLDGSRVQSRFTSYYEGLLAASGSMVSPAAFNPTQVTPHESATVVDHSSFMTSYCNNNDPSSSRPDTSEYLGAMFPF